MRSSEKLDQLLPALAKARPNFGEITKTQTNLYFGKPYADLSDILPQVIPALAAEGLILLGTMEPHESGGVLVTERLMHVSEQYLESLIILSYPPGQLQKLGGDITYFRRYADNTMLALSADQDLDDARPESPSAERRPARKPVTKPAPTPEVATRMEPTNGSPTQEFFQTVGPGKPTKEQITTLWDTLIEVYTDADQRDQLIREALQIPAPQAYNFTRFRLSITPAQYLDLLQGAAWAQQAQQEARDQNDVPQGDTSPTGEGGEPLDAPEAPQEAESVRDGAPAIDIDADDPPDFGLEKDDLVPLAFMPALWGRAEKSGNRLLLRSILKDAEQVTMGQYYFAWVQVGPKPAKV